MDYAEAVQALKEGKTVLINCLSNHKREIKIEMVGGDQPTVLTRWLGDKRWDMSSSFAWLTIDVTYELKEENDKPL